MAVSDGNVLGVQASGNMRSCAQNPFMAWMVFQIASSGSRLQLPIKWVCVRAARILPIG